MRRIFSMLLLLSALLCAACPTVAFGEETELARRLAAASPEEADGIVRECLETYGLAYPTTQEELQSVLEIIPELEGYLTISDETVLQQVMRKTSFEDRQRILRKADALLAEHGLSYPVDDYSIIEAYEADFTQFEWQCILLDFELHWLFTKTSAEEYRFVIDDILDIYCLAYPTTQEELQSVLEIVPELEGYLTIESPAEPSLAERLAAAAPEEREAIINETLDALGLPYPQTAEELNIVFAYYPELQGYLTIRPPKAGIAGDADSDGTVDLTDAILILQYCCGWDVTVDIANADANGDGTADISDALLVLRTL